LSEQTSLIAHLDTCRACQRKLEALAASRRAWEELRELAGQETAGLAQQPADAAAPEPLALDFLAPSDDPRAVGRLGTYEVVEVIGRGGFGVVLKAIDPSLNRTVAIKVLSPALATSGTARRRFDREARAAAAIPHENIIAIHAVEPGGTLPSIVMQYVPGRSLQQRLDQDGPLELKDLLRIGAQVAAGLAAAHAHGLIHRDIKPSNILLENCLERVKITDFGLARAIDDASLTQSGIVAGTPLYMAPEQARGEPLDGRADLFSLGSVLYAMAAGRPPFRADTTMAVLRRVCEEDPPADPRD
jgi:serine/threonine-protein kinase